MDGDTFDHLAQVLSHAIDRRATLRSLRAVTTFLAIGGVIPGDDPAATARRKRRHRGPNREVTAQGPCGGGGAKANACKKAKQCCSGYCDKKKKRCRCKGAGQSCAEDRNCCPDRTGRTCQDGRCQGVAADCDVCARCPETSLQAAIEAAAPGATLRLCAETYRGTFTIGKDLTLRGAGDGENGTILDGEGIGTVVTVPDGAEVALENLRITGGEADPTSINPGGGGVRSFGSARLTNCTVQGNHSAGHGGGIYSVDLTLGNCTVRDNDAQGFGGGIFGAGTATLSGCTVSDNTAHHGGGIFSFASCALTECSISGNVAQQDGGGFYNSAGTVALAASSVTDNEAGTQGGGIFNDHGGVTIDETSSVTDNIPNDCIDFGSNATGCP